MYMAETKAILNYTSWSDEAHSLKIKVVELYGQ